MRRPLLIGAVAVVLVATVAAAGAYAYFFSGLRSAPARLALASPTGAAGTVAPALAGTWTVTGGSVARYRVNEVFAGTTTNHEAVAETGDLGGSITVDSAGGQNSLGKVAVSARLTSLHSVDTVAGFNVSRRDEVVQRSLETARFPEASFAAEGVRLPADLQSASGLTVPGRLTIHGVTRPAGVGIQRLQVAGATAQAIGQVTFDMTDFGVQPPTIRITTVQPSVILEFELKLARA